LLFEFPADLSQSDSGFAHEMQLGAVDVKPTLIPCFDRGYRQTKCSLERALRSWSNLISQFQRQSLYRAKTTIGVYKARLFVTAIVCGGFVRVQYRDQTLGVRVAIGAFVSKVEPRSPASEAGLALCDLIVSFPGVDMRGQGDHPSFRAAMREAGIDLIFLVAPTSTDERIKLVSEASSGFVYAVSRTGVTGVRQNLSEATANLVQRVRRFTDLPVAVGFGVSTPEHVAEVWQHADAAVVGSRLVAEIESNASDPALVEKVGALTRWLVSSRSAR